MTPTYRKFRALRDKGMHPREIADLCGVKTHTVWSILSRYRDTDAAQYFRDRHREYQRRTFSKP
jgi:DNA-directed RNA polymerase specialized sigma24 family protein